jgi:hypothetical protein
MTEDRPYVFREGDAVPQAWNVEFRLYPGDDLIAVVLSNKRVRAGSIRRYAMPAAVNIALFGKPPVLPDFVNTNIANLKLLEGIYKLESGDSIHVKAVHAATGRRNPAPVLAISGMGQQAIDLLYSGASLPDIEKLSLELNEKTSAYIEALKKNDVTVLKTILPAVSSEETVRRWNDFVRQNGALEEYEILGTSSLNQQGGQTFVRLKFQKHAGVYKVTWRDQKLWQQAEDRLQPEITSFLRKSFVDFPLNVFFLPQSETDFATYDLFKGRSVSITFADAGKLLIHTKGGDVVAQKIR